MPAAAGATGAAAPLAGVAWQSDWATVLQAPFMRHAFAAGSLVALAAGLVGYFVVVRRDAFAAHALAHIGFPGATGAVLVGVPVTLGLVVFCSAGGLAIGLLGKRVSDREIATGTVLAFATALGVLFASLTSQSAGTATRVLFGNLLAVSTSQLQVFALVTLAVVAAVATLARPLTFASVAPDVAEARGVAVRGLGVAFMLLLALVVAMAVQVVGTLLLFALVVTPAATALMLTARPVAVAALGTGIALASVWVGLMLSAMVNLPPSFFIVSLATAGWLATTVATRDRHAAVDAGPVADDHHAGGHSVTA